MTERTRRFHREAYRAVGPVLFATLGVVLLLIWGILLVVGALPAPLGTTLASVGVAALLTGVLWGALDSGEARRTRRQGRTL